MIKKSIEISGQTLTIETGRMAKQASGSVLVTYGETVVLVASTANKGIESDRGFFPLTIDYREKFYASGKIPGGFFKREARPSEKEIIGCRLTDRPLRPLFPKGFHNETQVFISVLSFDGENNGDILGTIGASASLAISDIPWDGPVASIKVGRLNGELKINPTNTEMEESDLNSKRFFVGCEIKSISYMKAAMYYMQQNDLKDEKWEPTNIVGMKFSF